jgi:hypothetical protein
VRDWLARLKNPARLRFAPAALVIPGLGLVAGAVLLFALTVAGIALSIATRNVSHMGRFPADGAYLTYGWTRIDRELAHALDSLVSPSRTPTDSNAIRQVAVDTYVELAHGAEHSNPRDTVAMRIKRELAYALNHLGAGGADIRTHHHFDDSLYAAINRWTGLPRSFSRERLAAFGSAPALAHLREFARKAANTPPHRYPPPYIFPTEDLLWEHADGRLAVPWVITTGIEAAVAQCTLYLMDQRHADCAALAFELMRAGSYFIRSPIVDEYWRGLQLANSGAWLLGHAARDSRNFDLMRTGTFLSHRVQAAYRRRWSPERPERYRMLWAYGGSLAYNAPARFMVHDSGLMPYERWMLIRSLVTGFCLNAREILFGVSPHRLELVSKSMPDEEPLWRTIQWIRVHRGMIDRWIEDPAREFVRLRPGEARESSALDFIKWLGFADLHARLRFCASPPLPD